MLHWAATCGIERMCVGPSWLPFSADSYDLDLSVVFRDKYQWEIWKNTAGKSARMGWDGMFSWQSMVDQSLQQAASLVTVWPQTTSKIEWVGNTLTTGRCEGCAEECWKSTWTMCTLLFGFSSLQVSLLCLNYAKCWRTDCVSRLINCTN